MLCGGDMKDLSEFGKILVHRLPVDGRKQINGLAAIVNGEMKADLYEKSLFVFISKRKDRLRILYWDKNGFALWTKRLEKEKFRWPLRLDGEVIKITAKELNWLLEGIDIASVRPHKSLNFSTL